MLPIQFPIFAANSKLKPMNIKEEIQKKCKNMNEGNIQESFKSIAETLLKNFCLQCGDKKYYFAEIEFYYYDKKSFKKVWNERTYPRDNREAGDLFFHYSGFDICFDSSFNDGKFGGILIRSLIDATKTDNKFVTGPLLCVNEVLNACAKAKEWPIIVELTAEEKQSQNRDCVISEPPITRYGITYDKDKEIQDVLWCFFDKRMLDKNNQKNKYANSSWDFVKQEAKDITRYYHRFD
jgi:hypothetical protein